jgi:hypothetical protein
LKRRFRPLRRLNNIAKYNLGTLLVIVQVVIVVFLYKYLKANRVLIDWLNEFIKSC